jgi:hypothetical protein
MNAQEILNIRNQMIKDIKADQTSLVISDAVSYGLTAESWPLEISVAEGKIDLVKFFVNSGARITNKDCLKENVKNAKSVVIFEEVTKHQNIQEHLLELLPYAASKNKVKVVDYIAKNVSVEATKELTKTMTQSLFSWKNKDQKKIVDILIKKFSIDQLDILMNVLKNIGDTYTEQHNYLLHYKLEKEMKDSKTATKKRKI